MAQLTAPYPRRMATRFALAASSSTNPWTPFARRPLEGWEPGRSAGQSRTTALALGLLAPLLGGALTWTGCGGDKSVPFKKPGASDARSEQGAAETAEDAGARVTTDAGVVGAAKGDRHVMAPSAITLGDLTLDRSRGHIYASLAPTPDGPIHLLAADDEGPLQLEHAVRQDRGLGAPVADRTLTTSDLGSCHVVSAQLDALSSNHWVASANLACAGTHAAEAESPPSQPRPSQQTGLTAPPHDAADPVRLYQRTWVVDARNRRILERMTMLRDPEGPPAPAVEFSAADLDGDGHPDVVARVELNPGTDNVFDFALEWLDRPGGIARHDREPEASLMREAERARRQLPRRPDRSLALARSVIEFRDQLCGQQHAPPLSLGDRLGLPCARSQALARASAVLVVGRAKRGDVVGALRARARLDSAESKPLPIDRKRADAALGALPKEPAYRFVQGPKLLPQRLPALHRPRVVFIDETQLLVLGNPNRTWNVSTGDLSVTGAGGSALFVSPDGKWTATELYRDCDGYHIALVPSEKVVEGVVLGAPERTPLVLPTPAPPGAQCPLTGTLRRDDGALVLETFGAQHFGLRQHGRRFTVPLEGLTGGAPGPAPVADHGVGGAGNAATATVTDHGIVVTTGRQARLVPAAEVPRPLAEVSLSPSGRRVAVVQGQQVWMGEANISAPEAIQEDGAPATRRVEAP